MSKWLRSVKNSSINKRKMTENEQKSRDIVRHKEILSLMTKCLSPNQIANHYAEISKEQKKPHRIRNTLRKYKTEIERINDKFDRIASQMITIIEMDETFKGMGYKVLVVMDSITGYIFLVKKILRKSEKCIKSALNPLKDVLIRTKLVLTDGAVYFPKIIRDLCPNAVHQICLVHVMRGLNAYLKEIYKPYAKNYRNYRNLLKKLDNLDDKIQDKQYKLKKLKQQFNYQRDCRIKLQAMLGVKPHQKGSLKKYPSLKEKNLKINSLSAQIRSVENTLYSERVRFNEILSKINCLTPKVNSLWNKYMKERQLYREFYDLFLKHNQEYIIKKEEFIRKLRVPKPNNLRKKMVELLEKIPGLDVVNRKESGYPLKREFQNTNGIESFNSRFRPLLDSLKNVANSSITQLRFDLFRLYINTTVPNNPSRSNCSPLECYGYNLRGRSTFDLVVDGLPPGRQSIEILPQQIIDLTARKLVKMENPECKA